MVGYVFYTYNIAYQDDSTTSGVLSLDRLSLPTPPNELASFVFGCVATRTRDCLREPPVCLVWAVAITRSRLKYRVRTGRSSPIVSPPRTPL
ncbi:hypothetical protein Taro_045377 [Colocasia esculenta]|uniref:Uncharacterized protein n=1 Tax=Colocasia esculenta TaxID=4460 RepID=A0A843X4Q3_COLES|nr:hypothetical protein [Colocasia esculenta]